MADEHEELEDARIARIVESLRVMPAVDPSAIARVLVATAAAEQEDGRRARARSRRRPLVAVAAVAAVVALVVGLARWTPGEPAAAPAVAAAGAPSAAVPIDAKLAATSDEPAPVTVQLVMRAPLARRLSLVGDFTGWDDARIPMQRDPASGLWSATVTVRPGRHVYAFIADDTLWMRDPSAPVATDPDFGRPGSLLLVGRP